MEIIYLPQADEDIHHWIKTGNKAILKKIAELTRAIGELYVYSLKGHYE